eukprot:scaffold136592_cov22-Tisochrysis_lutea.AAC.2
MVVLYKPAQEGHGRSMLDNAYGSSKQRLTRNSWESAAAWDMDTVYKSPSKCKALWTHLSCFLQRESGTYRGKMCLPMFAASAPSRHSGCVLKLQDLLAYVLVTCVDTKHHVKLPKGEFGITQSNLSCSHSMAYLIPMSNCISQGSHTHAHCATLKARLDAADRSRIERLEIFDEFEEWHMIQESGADVASGMI